MSSKIISDITRLVTTSADPTLFGSVEFVDALKVIALSKLNPKAPSWVPRPKMLRYHAVLFAGVPNALCAKQ